MKQRTLIIIILAATTIVLYQITRQQPVKETQQIAKDSTNTKNDSINEQQQHVSIDGSLITVIDSLATWHNLKLKFIGNKPLKERFLSAIDKPGNFEQQLNATQSSSNSSDKTKFVYNIQADTLIVDNYYRYTVDTQKIKPLQETFIKSYYDKSRKSKVIEFKYLSPSIILDTILTTYHKLEMNKTHNRETVSGLLPLEMGLKKLQSITFDTHGWVFDKKNKSIVNK
jgi:hypothetical protein